MIGWPRPSEFNVLVLPETIPEKTKGGIILTDSVKDSDKAAGRRARLVAVSPVAFSYAEFPEGTKPIVGDVVLIAKYAGTLVDGLDGREYRVIKDSDVMAVESSDPSKAEHEKALNMIRDHRAQTSAWKRGNADGHLGDAREKTA